MVWFKIFGVAQFMVNRLIAFNIRRILRSKNQVAALDRDYCNWSNYVLKTFNVDLKVTGRENIPVGGSRKWVMMSNHQSQLDIPCIVATMNRRVGFVAKRELGNIPVLSYFMHQVGCIFIDRSDRRGAHLALEKAAKEMGENPIMIFPEGTRSKDAILLPIKQGGCRLAQLADALILPIKIEGTRNAGENRKKNSILPFPVELKIFPVLETRGLEEGKAGFNKIKDYIEQCWNSPSAHN